jgi:hypothetical protein
VTDKFVRRTIFGRLKHTPNFPVTQQIWFFGVRFQRKGIKPKIISFFMLTHVCIKTIENENAPFDVFSSQFGLIFHVFIHTQTVFQHFRLVVDFVWLQPRVLSFARQNTVVVVVFFHSKKQKRMHLQ